MLDGMLTILPSMCCSQIETSDPAELTAAYLASEWGSLLHGGQGKQSTDVEDKPGFAKPRRPGKR